MTVLSPRIQISLALITGILLCGTVYSIRNGTFLDTSNPLLASLPHPAYQHGFFANKKNILNQWFVKKSWGWTSLAFWAVWLTAPAGSSAKDGLAIGRWIGATLVWTLFVGWFFGPSLFDRIGDFSGRECVILLPPGISAAAPGSPTVSEMLYSAIAVPAKFCLGRVAISPESHPALFAHPPESLEAAAAHVPSMPELKESLKGFVPRFYHGHDVSGHTFLLTLSVLLLVDHLVRARRPAQANKASAAAHQTPPTGLLWLVSLVAGWALVGLWLVMLGATAVYYHTWQEKLSGFLIAVVGYVISQYPFDPAPATVTPPVVVTKAE
ncbi:hypothetical protein FRB93_009895 [Tulasnella sp. JGI-2019a]|nr:hypothetical protein FRB93_009895 [Tulasnella sp. JGI-2019a]